MLLHLLLLLLLLILLLLLLLGVWKSQRAERGAEECLRVGRVVLVRGRVEAHNEGERFGALAAAPTPAGLLRLQYETERQSVRQAGGAQINGAREG